MDKLKLSDKSREKITQLSHLCDELEFEVKTLSIRIKSLKKQLSSISTDSELAELIETKIDADDWSIDDGFKHISVS